MDCVRATLRRLGNIFISWFIMQCAAGTWMAWQVIQRLRETGSVDALAEGTGALAVTTTLLVEVALLALGIWLFRSLARLGRGARTVLLALAWISTASAVAGLLAAPGSAQMQRWLGATLPGVDLRRLV